MMQRHINGILLLDKPIGLTSNQALQKIKYLFKAKKAGHTGSLDPIATGMLPICFGHATKFSQFLLESAKSYFVTAKLGVATSTGDREGEVIAESAYSHITQEQLMQTLQKFLGESEQIPPMYSAIKHQGQPLYKLARQGLSIEREPRKIKITAINLDQLIGDTFTFTVHCSKGTYVRTLVEDICKDLNSVGHVIELRRLTVTPYHQYHMYSLTELMTLAEKSDSALLACLLPIETAVQIFPAVKLTASAAFYLTRGESIRAQLPNDHSLVRLVSKDAKFLGMGEIKDGRLKPHRMVGI